MKLSKACRECGFVLGQQVHCAEFGIGVVILVGRCHAAKFDTRILDLPNARVSCAPCAEHRANFNTECFACNREVAASHILTADKDGRLLYAITLERYTMYESRMQWIPHGFVYAHAHNALHARQAYEANAEPRCRVIAVAPVIGYHVEDKHGDRLIV